MKKVISLVCVALLFSTTAFAYDHLVTDDTAKITAAGEKMLNVGLLYTTASDMLDKDGNSFSLGDDATRVMVPVKFRYGVMDNLEAFGIVAFEKWDMGNAGESGLGDLWLGAKYGLMPDNILTLRGALDIPLGDDDKGLGEMGGLGIDVGAMTSKRVSMIDVNAQAGFRYNVEDSDSKMQPGLGIYIDGEGSYALSEILSMQLGLELMLTGDSKYDGNEFKDTGMNYLDLNVGAMYMMSENMGIKGDLLFNVIGKNIDKNMGVLISFRYGM